MHKSSIPSRVLGMAIGVAVGVVCSLLFEKK